VTDLLQRELSRIANRAPTADVPGDTWQQGRRSVQRTRIAAVATAVAVVAVVAGLVSWLPQGGSTPPVAEGALGVPETVRIPGYKELTPTSDLAVGTQAVALKSLDHEPVVVDAEDGTYRALSLPGFQGRGGVLSLSPDGRRLAWGWSDGDDSIRDGIGIRVVDLATGEWDSYDLRDKRGGTFVRSLSWSPDGRWVVWTAVEPDAPDGSAAGRIGPDGTSVRVPLPRSEHQNPVLAVGDDGLVLVATPDQVLHWDGEVVDRSDRAGDRAPVVVSARDGVLVEATTDEFNVAVDYRLTSGPDLPEWRAKLVLPLGQLSDGTVVVLLGGTMEERMSPTPPALRLQLLDPRTGEVTSVGTFEGDVTDVAVGLMTAKRPTVSESVRDEPGRGPDTSLFIGLGVAGVLSVLAGLRWLWRRYRAA
jgi:hypothetical protein